MTMVPLVLVAALVTALAIALLRRTPLAWRLGDRPNERSLHTEVTPRVGGLAILVGALPLAAWYASTALALVLGAAALLAIVSLADDARSLPVAVRLPAHFAAAIVAVLVLAPDSLHDSSGWALAVVVVCAIAWMTNLFNFMDGADGLAGGMAAIGFGTFGFVALQSGALPLAASCMALAGAAVGFLGWNLPPARVFMGDAGSIPLGFLAGALGLAGVTEAAWPWWFPLMVFSPFIVDASVTLLRRALRREPVWRAHREHAYQRLVLAGWSKRRLAAASFALMAAAAASACLALRQEATGRYAIISAWAVALLLLLAMIERRCRNSPIPDQETPTSGLGP
jgi:UDP-GlcNAc:undecaprenyl-phosphate GlcNAc-1-phosphate transferase